MLIVFGRIYVRPGAREKFVTLSAYASLPKNAPIWFGKSIPHSVNVHSHDITRLAHKIWVYQSALVLISSNRSRRRLSCHTFNTTPFALYAKQTGPNNRFNKLHPVNQALAQIVSTFVSKVVAAVAAQALMVTVCVAPRIAVRSSRSDTA